MAMVIQVSDCTCPKCGATEIHPDTVALPIWDQRLQVRGFKFCDSDGHWWSQCLVCSGAYDRPGGTYDPAGHKTDAGWF